jgi:hypothetical protein
MAKRSKTDRPTINILRNTTQKTRLSRCEFRCTGMVNSFSSTHGTRHVTLIKMSLQNLTALERHKIAKIVMWNFYSKEKKSPTFYIFAFF